MDSVVDKVFQIGEGFPSGPGPNQNSIQVGTTCLKLVV
jgi:hypothetical protein